jgi:hypothetical protein
MSLVYEALQKAEREKRNKTGPAPVAAPPAPVKQPEPTVASVPPPAPRVNYLGLLVACVSIVALVAIVVIVVQAARSLGEKRSRPVAAESPPAPVAEPPPTVAAPSPTTSTANDSRFRLTGITGNEEIGYGAFINGRLVYPEHYVDGAIVKKIERDRVTLNVDGHEVVVRLF